MITNYEYEDWLLENWAIWSKADCVVKGYRHGGIGIGLTDGLSDDDMLKVDHVVSGMDAQDKRVIKGYYWRREYDDYGKEINSVVRRFSWLYNEA